MKKIDKRKIILFFGLAITLVAGIVFIVFDQSKQAKAAWYSDAGVYWNYRKKITIDHTKVSNTDQSYFTVLVNRTDTDLRDASNSGHVGQSDGGDFVFTSSDSTSKLDHELEKYNPATGELVAWVEVPSLSHETDTELYLYYGNATCADQWNSSGGVWDEGGTNNYKAIWHLGDAGPTNAINSVSGGTTATQSGGVTFASTGRIGSSISGDGVNDYFDVNSEFGKPSTITISAWFKTTSNGIIFGQNNNVQPPTSATSYIPTLWVIPDGRLRGELWTGSTLAIYSAGSVADGQWHNVTIVGNTNIQYLYLDGGLVNSRSGTLEQSWWARTSVGTGFASQREGYGSVWKYFGGSLDEVRVSSSVRSADWILTEYNNQNSPSTFYSFADEVAKEAGPPTNPTSITALYESGGAPIENNAGSDATPYFEWPAVGIAGGATDTADIGDPSGVAGYYSYFGTSCGDGGANPQISRGILSDTGGGLHYSSDTNVAVPEMSEAGSYCLRMKTIDNVGNVSSIWEAYLYSFENIAPNAPSFVAVSPAGYSSTNSFDFSWPTATDNSGGSGILGYQYKKDNGDAWSATTTSNSISDVTAYQTGANIFLVRSVDNAGNFSSSVQTTYYYSNEIPTKPTGFTANPQISESNSFSFSWTAPVHTRTIVDYGYSVNVSPTANNLTWTGSAATSLSADHYATLQGENTIYLVAKDDSGSYGLNSENIASETFNCTTPAPPTPTAVSVTDSSDRNLSRYMLTLQWVAGNDQNSQTFSHYSVQRSVDGESYSEIATITSTAYIDASSLSNTTRYYYRIKAVDNAGSESAPSTEVYKTPTGKFDAPPNIVSEPTVVAKATSATIEWTVDRESSSSIRFGSNESELTQNQISTTTETSHSIEIVGLSPNTTYYYQVQSLDSFRDYSLESAYSVSYHFITLSSPEISNVSISNLTLGSANISWETSSASRTRVYYGKEITYGSVIPESDNSMTTNHSVTLSGLEEGTKYHFKIQGDDIDGNNLSSDDYVFSTLPKPKISQIAYQPDFTGPAPAVVITWITNVPISSSVEYSPKESSDSLQFEESQSALVIDHKVTLSNLKDGTDYKFQIKGVDQFGNQAISDIQILQTGLDSRPPKISNIVVESSNVGSGSDQAQIAISWETDEESTSQVDYGPGFENNTALKKKIADQGYSVKHLAIITGLNPASTYHFKVTSIDRTGNPGVSENIIATTGSVQKTAFSMIISTLSSIFGWLAVIFK